MLLYKFKGGPDALFALDIAIHERLFCANYDDLNDPFEGQFKTVYQTRMPGFLNGLPLNMGPINGPGPVRPIVQYCTLSELPGDTRVCSMTSAWDDVRMWALYGDSSRGLAFEFDIDPMHPKLHKVEYVDQLPKLSNGLLNSTTAVDALSYKTYHWRYEAEWRFITGDPYIALPGQLKRVLVGRRAPTAVVEALLKVAPPQATVHMVGLDPEGVRITIGPALPR